LRGVKERFLPRRVGRVAADDVVAASLGPAAGFAEIRHLERDVMDAPAASRQEAVQEAVRPHGLQDLDAAPAREHPGGPPEGPGGLAPVGHASEDGDQGGGRVGDARQGDDDMIELDRGIGGLSILPGRRPACASAGRFHTSQVREETPMSNQAPWLLHLDEKSYDEALVATEGVMMVDFWAEWCGPCRAVAPVLEDLARASGGTVTLAKVNVDENPGLAARYGIRSIPTILFVKDGKVRDQLVGAVPKPQIQAKLAAVAAQ
jgi:thioredoxin 1